MAQATAWRRPGKESCVTSKEFIREHLRPINAELARKDGDHYVYRLPNGRSIIVPMGGKHSKDDKRYLVKRLRQLLAEPAR